MALSYGAGDKALEAMTYGAVLMDRSHWGRLRVGGGDRVAFMHNQSTADFTRLAPGSGTDTVFVTATARTLDLATAYVLPNQARRRLPAARPSAGARCKGARGPKQPRRTPCLAQSEPPTPFASAPPPPKTPCCEA